MRLVISKQNCTFCSISVPFFCCNCFCMFAVRMPIFFTWTQVVVKSTCSLNRVYECKYKRAPCHRVSLRGPRISDLLAMLTFRSLPLIMSFEKVVRFGVQIRNLYITSSIAAKMSSFVYCLYLAGNGDLYFVFEQWRSIVWRSRRQAS